MSQAVRIGNYLAKLDVHPAWADPYYLMRGACVQLVGIGTDKMMLIDQQLNTRAWESAAMHAIPDGFALAGLRLEREGSKQGYMAVVTDGAEFFESGHLREQPGLAILEAALFAALSRHRKPALMQAAE